MNSSCRFRSRVAVITIPKRPHHDDKAERQPSIPESARVRNVRGEKDKGSVSIEQRQKQRADRGGGTARADERESHEKRKLR